MSTTFDAAFYARVSTEDRQSPEDSIAWQRSIAAALIDPQGGRIVADYLDVGVSRSLPWSRRPEATRLLADCARMDRGFDAIVIGEPQRAFAGAQYGLTAPLLWHHGVELWVPEVGGRVDPDSEAHDLVMSLFGGLSKAERARIQRRVRSSMQTMARAGGRYLGGRPPYGYRLVPIGAHPNPEKARMGATLNRLEPDPETASGRPPHLPRATRRCRLLDDRPPPQHGGHPLTIAARSPPQLASQRTRLGRLGGTSHPPQRAVHRPRGLRTSTTRLRAHRPLVPRGRPRPPHALERSLRLDLVPRTHPRGPRLHGRLDSRAID